MSEIPYDVQASATECLRKIKALKLPTFECLTSDGFIEREIANAILAERQKNADLLKRTGDILIIENPHSPTGELLLSLASAILSPAEKETELWNGQ
jgi:hypothetical protein